MIALVALAFQSLEMIRDAIDFRSCLRDDLRRVVCRDRRFFRSFSCLVGRVFGPCRRSLGLRRGSFGLFRTLLIARRAACGERNRESGCQYDRWKSMRVGNLQVEVSDPVQARNWPSSRRGK
jgi:hypothetical protein